MPIYAQLERAIRFAVATGKLRVGGQLPTVRQLAVDLCINANTVAKVYAQLERDGVLETRRGVGTFVREQAREEIPNAGRKRQLRLLAEQFLSEAGALGFTAEEAIHQVSTVLKKEAKRNVQVI